MYTIEKVVRLFNDERKEIKFIAGVGNLTADIIAKKVKLKSGGEAFVAGGFGQSIAFDYYDNGEEKVKYYSLEAWGKTAENLGRFGKKGIETVIIGRLENRSYKNQDGEMATRETLVVEKFSITSRARDKFFNENIPVSIDEYKTVIG